MNISSGYLRDAASELAESATDVLDVEHLEEPITQLIVDLADVLASEGELNVATLREAGIDDERLAHILRTILAQSIEVLRVKLSPDDFPDEVHALRQGIRRHIPDSAKKAEEARRFRDLMHGEIVPDASIQPIIGFLRALLRTVHDMVYVHDLNGNMLYLNQGGLDMLDFNRSDVLEGASVYDFLVPDYIELVEEQMVAVGNSVAPYVIELYSKSGDRIPVEIDTRVFFDENRKPEGVVGIARDLRLDRRFQAEIGQAHRRFDTLVRALPLGVVVTDLNFNVTDANTVAASIIGAPSVNTMIGLHIEELGEGDGAGMEALRSVSKTLSEQRAQIDIQTRFGKRVACEITVAPMMERPGKLEGLLILLCDREAAKSAPDGERFAALGDLLPRIAHEINNPLTGVIGYAEMMKQTLSDEKQLKRLESVLEEAHRCRRTIQNLMHFSTCGHLAVKPRDINALVAEAMDMCGYQLRLNKIGMELELADDLPAVNADTQFLQRAILNIVTNASEAIKETKKEPATITVKTWHGDGKVHIAVTDEGPGVPADVQGRIFEPFFTTREVGEGMGLGLSSAYAIARDHGGELTFKSSSEGACFVISLPTA